MATWVFSMDETMTVTGDFKKMSGSEEVVQMTHKEELPSCINWDGDDRQLLREHCCHALIPCDRISAKHPELSGSLTKR